MAFLKALPLRALSRAWGTVNNWTLPEFAREPVYKGWTWAFDCNLEEMRDPLNYYRNLAQFFTRHLKVSQKQFLGCCRACIAVCRTECDRWLPVSW